MRKRVLFRNVNDEFLNQPAHPEQGILFVDKFIAGYGGSVECASDW